VAQDFAISGAESSESIVETLEAQVEAIQERVNAFLSNITTVGALIRTNIGSLRNESEAPPSDSETPGAADSGARRRLGEEASDCTHGARLQVSIEFASAVEASVLDQIKEAWPSLVDIDDSGATACTEPEFDAVIVKDSVQEPDEWLVLVFLVSGGVVLCCCIVAACAYFRASRRRTEPKGYIMGTGDDSDVENKAKYTFKTQDAAEPVEAPTDSTTLPLLQFN